VELLSQNTAGGGGLRPVFKELGWGTVNRDQPNPGIGRGYFSADFPPGRRLFIGPPDRVCSRGAERKCDGISNVVPYLGKTEFATLP